MTRPKRSIKSVADRGLNTAASAGDDRKGAALLDAGSRGADGAIWWAAAEGTATTFCLLVRRGARLSGAAIEVALTNTRFGILADDALAAALDHPGCMSPQDAAELRARLIQSVDPKLERLRQRLQLEMQVKSADPTPELAPP